MDAYVTIEGIDYRLYPPGTQVYHEYPKGKLIDYLYIMFFTFGVGAIWLFFHNSKLQKLWNEHQVAHHGQPMIIQPTKKQITELKQNHPKTYKFFKGNETWVKSPKGVYRIQHERSL